MNRLLLRTTAAVFLALAFRESALGWDGCGPSLLQKVSIQGGSKWFSGYVWTKSPFCLDPNPGEFYEDACSPFSSIQPEAVTLLPNVVLFSCDYGDFEFSDGVTLVIPSSNIQEIENTPGDCNGTNHYDVLPKAQFDLFKTQEPFAATAIPSTDDSGGYLAFSFNKSVDSKAKLDALLRKRNFNHLVAVGGPQDKMEAAEDSLLKTMKIVVFEPPGDGD